MSSTNFDRMMQLVTETFAAHSDPNQLDVDEEIIAQLQQLHRATLSEHIEGDGPVVWILLIPTTTELMKQFVTEKISESELLNKTPLNVKYDALYLCSASVLQEYRQKGLAKQITLDAIKQIRGDHPIRSLFVWNFTREGGLLANSIAKHEGLPLFERPQHS